MTAPLDRLPLDAIVTRLREPAFAARFRRRLSFRETSPHVSAVMLASADPDSVYVRHWREHARGCPMCAKLYAYFGFDLEG